MWIPHVSVTGSTYIRYYFKQSVMFRDSSDENDNLCKLSYKLGDLQSNKTFLRYFSLIFLKFSVVEDHAIFYIHHVFRKWHWSQFLWSNLCQAGLWVCLSCAQSGNSPSKCSLAQKPRQVGHWHFLCPLLLYGLYDKWYWCYVLLYNKTLALLISCF